jgi:YD repeat-containing protein
MTEEEVDSQPEVADEPGLLDLVAEASGVDETLFESASEEVSESEPEDIVDSEEDSDILEEIGEEDEVEPEPSPETSGVKKRIGKLVERAEKAESQIDELKAQLEGLKNEPKPEPEKPVQDGSEKYDGILDLKELDQREEDAEHLREWLMQNPDGGDYEDRSGSEYDVEYDQAKRLIVETDRDLRKNLPKAKAQLQMRERVTEEAFKQFDWMKDKASPEFREMAALLQTNPKAKKFYETEPLAIMLFGYATEGVKSLGRKAKPDQVKPAPKVPGSPSRATPTSSKRKTLKSKLLERAAETGDPEDAASYIESLL